MFISAMPIEAYHDVIEIMAAIGDADSGEAGVHTERSSLRPLGRDMDGTNKSQGGVFMRSWLFIQALFLAALISATPAIAAGCAGYDACWWNGLRQDQKVAVVQGMISAAKYAYATAQEEDAQVFKLGLQNARILHFYKTPDEYVKAIDNFYSSNSRSGLVVAAVLVCLADNPPQGCSDLIH